MTDAGGTTAAGPDAALVDALAQVSFTVQLALTEVASAHELSLTQLRVLGILRDRSAAMAELARHLGLDRSSVSGLIDRAERRGLLARGPRPEDGRGVAVRLTPEGAALAARLGTAVGERLTASVAGLTDQERSLLTGLAQKVADGS